MTNELNQGTEIETTQPTLVANLPGSAAATDEGVHDSAAPAQSMPGNNPVNKQTLRSQIGSMFAPVRSEMEFAASAPLNAIAGPRYKGTFEVRFDNPNEVTPKALLAFCGNGSVFFTPDSMGDYPDLGKMRGVDDGVDISALATRSKRPSHMTEESWEKVKKMWADISEILYTQSLAPLHVLIARVLAAEGMGGPKVSKKLRRSNDSKTADKHEVMCKVLDDLLALLRQSATEK
jgi:hypothetical protein